MKIRKPVLMALAIVASAVFTTSCTQTKEHNDETEEHHDGEEAEEGHHHDEEAEEGHHHDDGEEGEHHDHDAADVAIGEAKMWKPEGNGADLIKKDFHFIAGAMENIKPEVIKDDNGANILKLTADGTPTAFVFHQSQGNIGMDALINTDDFKGTVKLIHHAKNSDNYEFVSINGTSMKLGRVVDGAEKVFDEDSFSKTDSWFNLKASAAGAHYKGYIGNKGITHGHGDKMADGYVGIMLEGTGTVQVKSIEITVLEDE